MVSCCWVIVQLALGRGRDILAAVLQEQRENKRNKRTEQKRERKRERKKEQQRRHQQQPSLNMHAHSNNFFLGNQSCSRSFTLLILHPLSPLSHFRVVVVLLLADAVTPLHHDPRATSLSIHRSSHSFSLSSLTFQTFFLNKSSSPWSRCGRIPCRSWRSSSVSRPTRFPVCWALLGRAKVCRPSWKA